MRIENDCKAVTTLPQLYIYRVHFAKRFDCETTRNHIRENTYGPSRTNLCLNKIGERLNTWPYNFIM